MGILDLFIAAVMPVLKVLFITAVGLFLAIDGVDILGVDARKHVNNLVFFVFNPSLVGSNLAEYITFRSLVNLWFMPLNILFTFILGSALGFLLIKITRAPNNLRGLVVGCCAAGNLGNLPLIIIPAICKEKGTPFGDAVLCYKHGLAYASLSMALGAVYMWLYVYNIIRIYSANASDETRLDALIKCEDPATEAPERTSKHCGGSSLPLNDHLEVELAPTDSKGKVPFSEKIMHGIQMVLTKLNLKKVFAPSTIGAMVGLLVGIIPPLRHALTGQGAPLRVVQDSVQLLGEAAIPTVTLIVGANLLRGLKGSAVQVSTVVGIIAVRYIMLPIMGVVIIKSAIRFGVIHSEPLYVFVLLLQYALPPAMNIGTMTQLFGAGEAECSVIMLATYGLASISLTLWSAFFMWLVG